MATQVLPGGGFIGRLGEVVGQHWHDKRFVRTYVVPKDPKTPAQLDNRALFRQATQYAKTAMQQSGRWGLFDTRKIGEYAARLGQARRALGAGDIGRLLLPLTPTAGQTIIATNSTKVTKYNNGKIGILVTLPTPLTKCTCNMWVWKYDSSMTPIIAGVEDSPTSGFDSFFGETEAPEFALGETIYLTACWRERPDIVSPIGVMLPIQTATVSQ
jgi:hypothetical protein